MPALGMSISPRSIEPGSSFFEASPASQTEPLTHPHPAKIHVKQNPPCSKNRVGKFFSPKANLHLADELPTQTLQGKIRLTLAETASDDSIYADGNPIGKSDPFGLCVEGGRSPWDPLNGREEFALYRNRDGGFTDQWGQNHASAGMACHAYTPEAQRNMQGSLYGNLGWARTGAYLREAMIGLGVEASLASGTRMAVTSEMSLAQRILSAERTGSGLKADASHSAASFLSEAQLERGTSFTIKGGDDVVREFLQTPGGMNGKSGIFEYIFDPTKGVTHQRFIPGGGITGTPNQIVPR